MLLAPCRLVHRRRCSCTSVIDNGGSGEINWCLHVMILGWLGKWLYRGIRDGHIPIDWLVRLADSPSLAPGDPLRRLRPASSFKPLARHRAYRRSLEPEPYYPTADGRPLQGPVARRRRVPRRRQDGEWVTADAESATLVLGPPRSGKTSAVIIPAVLGASGPVHQHRDQARGDGSDDGARGEIGEVWLFDPSGEYTELPQGVRRLCWSPVAAAPPGMRRC